MLVMLDASEIDKEEPHFLSDARLAPRRSFLFARFAPRSCFILRLCDVKHIWRKTKVVLAKMVS